MVEHFNRSLVAPIFLSGAQTVLQFRKRIHA